MRFSRSPYRLWIWFTVDFSLWFACMGIALWYRFPGGVPPAEWEFFWRFIPLSGATTSSALLYAGVYRNDVSNDWRWRNLWGGWLGGTALALAILFLLKIPYSRFAFLTGTGLFFASIVTGRLLVRTLLDRWVRGRPRVVVLGFDPAVPDARLSAVAEEVCLRFVEQEPPDPSFEYVQREEPDLILLNGSALPGERIRRLADFGSRLQVPVRILPGAHDLFLAQTETVSWHDTLLLRSQLHYGLHQQLAVKSLFDYVLGGVLFLLFLPLMTLVGLAVLLVDGRPVFYTQRRTGRRGEPFTVLKFRTMIPDADERGPELTQGAGDPRITTLGRVLRRWSLDELPQLVNVLRGEMSLVGPRPELPSITSEYEPQARRLLWLKPGLTGLSQVRGRQQLDLDEKLEIDQVYLTEYSIGMDLWILAVTALRVLQGRGAR